MLECGSLAGMVASSSSSSSTHNNHHHRHHGNGTGSGILKEEDSIAPPSPAPSSPNTSSILHTHSSINQRLNLPNSVSTPEQSSSTSSIPGSPIVSHPHPHSHSQSLLDSPQSNQPDMSEINTSISSNATSTSVIDSSESSSSTYLSSTLPASALTDPILRSLTKARNRREGPLFIFALKRFNQALESLKKDGEIEKNLKRMGNLTGVTEGIWRMIQEQCYARTVGPRVEELGGYRAFSDNV